MVAVGEAFRFDARIASAAFAVAEHLDLPLLIPGPWSKFTILVSSSITLFRPTPAAFTGRCRCTPAMAAGVTNRLWSVEELIAEACSIQKESLRSEGD